MLKYAGYDIVFQEIPDEVTLAINLSNCPYRCVGCHSPQLQQNIGEELTESALSDLLRKYEKSITCVCFMGGDATPEEVCRMASFVQKSRNRRIKTAWYSGFQKLHQQIDVNWFNFIKFGAYIAALGGLDKKTTNQRLYRIENGELIDITARMQRK